MRILFVLTCCLGLASFAGAAQVQQQDNPLPKKKGHHAQSSEQAATPSAHVSGKGKLQPHQNVSRAPSRTRSRTQTNMSGNPTFRTRHFDLANKPNSNIPNVKFKANSHIQGSQNWKGSNYTAFRTYSAQWHDRAWWRSHHDRIIFVFGGWYFWDAGYWYPAWGYDPYAFYPYDGPIYAYNDLPPDQVIANVQASLQAQGYYHGEIDGILGPLTRAALADYQRDRGLYITSAIDQPTLASLGMV